MNKLFIIAVISAIALLSTNAYAGGGSRDHRNGGSPQGGVSVGSSSKTQPFWQRRPGGSTAPHYDKTTVKVAPQVKHQTNWGCCAWQNVTPSGVGKQLTGQNIRDHRSVYHGH